MKPYLDQLRNILDYGTLKKDRTGIGTLSSFGFQARYNMDDGFPAITTKKLPWKSMVSELLWFISGSNNIQDLKKIYPFNKLWDKNYKDYLKRIGKQENNGSMGRIYGIQWRRWKGKGTSIDQLQEAINTIQNNPNCRRIIVNSWNAAEIGSKDVALPPCHSFFQFYVSDRKLTLQMYQRSCDMFLGVPLNIASYSLLLHMVARITELEPGEFIHTLGDAHIYLNHINAVKTQLSREPFPLPKLQIKNRDQETIDDFNIGDFALFDYKYHSAIKAEMAV